MLHQLREGFEIHGLLETIKEDPEGWRSIFTPSDFFQITVDDLLDNLKVAYSEQGSNYYDMEMDTYKAFVDCVQAMFYDSKIFCCLSFFNIRSGTIKL